MKKIILNQKSYLLYDEMINFKKSFDKYKLDGYDMIIFPPLLYLSMFKDSEYKVGTQNFHSYKMGSFTGELNLESLRNIGIKYTMIGHYERRLYASETYEISKEKLFKSISSKNHTILCVGEHKKTRNPFTYIKKELNYYLKAIDFTSIKYLSILYEPNWAVGSGKIQCTDKIEKIVNKIKKYVLSKYDYNIEVYYGGSIDKENIEKIMEISDGIVLGKVSTNFDELKDMLSVLKK